MNGFCQQRYNFCFQHVRQERMAWIVLRTAHVIQTILSPVILPMALVDVTMVTRDLTVTQVLHVR